jgi:hypothetical protein
MAAKATTRITAIESYKERNQREEKQRGKKNIIIITINEKSKHMQKVRVRGKL